MSCHFHILKALVGKIFFLILLVNCAGAATLTVPTDHLTIQAAIDAATPGDTIQVNSGTYYEHVDANKTLTLRGVDTGGGLPMVDAMVSGNAITPSAYGCTFQGFEARNSGNSGIWVTSDGNTISGNTATDNSLIGIGLDGSNVPAIK